MNYDSIYKKYSNTTIDWCPMDTKELYEKNLKNRFEDLKKFNWVNNTVTYKFNEYGFRCPNFKNTPSIAFLGCSYTLGIGINIEDNWSYLVAKELGLDYINLGQGGGSNDTAFRIAYHWIPILRPTIVFLLRPESSRIELVSTQNEINFLLPNCSTQYSSWYRNWLLEETNSFVNLQKNTLAISALCSSHNIKFQYLDSREFICEDNSLDLARDLAHPGVLSNKNIVSKILGTL